MRRSEVGWECWRSGGGDGRLMMSEDAGQARLGLTNDNIIGVNIYVTLKSLEFIRSFTH